jgi:hypothetical protein
MRAEDHERRALQLEHANSVLGDPATDPDLIPTVIENFWGAAFHWIAYGRQHQHGQHKENHTQLSRYLRDLNEPSIASHWDSLEHSRQGAMYGHAANVPDVQQAQDDWQAIRTWALT